MIKRISLLFIVFILTLTSGRVLAQNPILGTFSVTESNGSVFLTWSILAGNTCDGIRIFRSTDAMTFSQIGEIVGVCGSVSEEQSYDFSDEAPVENTINYYRLELGLSGFTQTLSVEIIGIDASGYQVRPNPFTDDGKIYFENPRNKSCTLEIFSSDGRKIFTTSTKEDYFQLSNSIIPKGLYVFSISGLDNGVVSGRIVVQE